MPFSMQVAPSTGHAVKNALLQLLPKAKAQL
jgi:hypothetical protein